MKSIHQKIIIAFSILLVVVIISILYYSATYKSNAINAMNAMNANIVNRYENFETTTSEEEAAPAPLSLSEKEQTVFDDLLSNKLTDSNIQSLIDSGFLTENMIEKFLQKLTGNSESFALQSSVEGDASAGHMPLNRNQQPLQLNEYIPNNDAQTIKTAVEKFACYNGVDPTNTIYARYY